ncbi:MAG: hypothetical protein ACREQ2_04620 [Candidatus Binatia bacterium]
MLIDGRAGVMTQQELREHVLRHGCYSPEQNQRIYEYWLEKAQRYLYIERVCFTPRMWISSCGQAQIGIVQEVLLDTEFTNA